MMIMYKNYPRIFADQLCFSLFKLNARLELCLQTKNIENLLPTFDFSSIKIYFDFNRFGLYIFVITKSYLGHKNYLYNF